MIYVYDHRIDKELRVACNKYILKGFTTFPKFSVTLIHHGKQSFTTSKVKQQILENCFIYSTLSIW